MNLADLKVPYNAIFSLGNNCIPAIQLRKNGLRRFAGPLDWMGTPFLPQVIRLLQNRFVGYLDYTKLQVVDQVSSELYNVRDQEYDLFMNHDFHVNADYPPYKLSYPAVKMKYDRRVDRFLLTLQQPGRYLFIRTDSDILHVRELVEVLRGLVAGEFRVLLVNHMPVPELTWVESGMNEVCWLHMPNQEIWEGNNYRWSFIFQGMSLA
ncbi:DUF1796 family putative cysteine peptidase [Paenibacillus sp. 7541]|uniref:DUF1796 family putative cysteine peptidase n=1 Tax=Paenibacillus sp. 7541 TaxID=2026236 RepID=UPI000BA7B6E9|nr:DUF1796 family putative cysteine peptidase [Paenibacillus sp. 7541]PAK55868.1 hypothetical protein CHH75_00940 [Paenibacillus sp. 7541]